MIFTKNIINQYIQSEISKNSNSDISINKDLSYYIKWLVFKIIAIGLKNGKSAIQNKSISEIQNVLIIRNDAIGDYVVSTSAIRLLKESNPNINIDIITSPKNDLIARFDPLIRNTFCLDYNGLLSIPFRKIRKIAKEQSYDAIISLNFSQTTNNAIISRIISKSADKITALHKKRKNIYSQVFNKLIDIDSIANTWADKMQNIVKFGFSIPKDINCKPYIYLIKDDLNYVYKFCVQNNLNYQLNCDNIININQLDADKYSNIGRKYCIVNISAGKASNEWGIDGCSEFLSKFIDLYPGEIFLSSSPNDYKLIDIIETRINNPKVKVFKGALHKFIAFLAGADLLISPDTGVIHLAAAAGIKIIGLYPAEYHLVQWRPDTDKCVQILNNKANNVATIDINEILTALTSYYN